MTLPARSQIGRLVSNTDADDRWVTAWGVAGIVGTFRAADEGSDGLNQPISIDTILASLRSKPGPLVVISKGHSGSRFLARTLEQAGVFMGADQNVSSDSMAWFLRFARPLITAPHFPDWPRLSEDEAFGVQVQKALSETLPAYLGRSQIVGPWGWKGSTLFVSSVIKEVFPRARMVHLIRDGRDVALSDDGQLNLPFYRQRMRRRPFRSLAIDVRGLAQFPPSEEDVYRLRITFGEDLDTWRGIPLDRRSILANRYQIQMQSWMRNIAVARDFGRRWPKDYLEVRYESLCVDPVGEFARVVDFAGLDMAPELERFLADSARTNSIGKWRGWDAPPDRRRDFDRAVELGAPLLRELGYLDAIETASGDDQ